MHWKSSGGRGGYAVFIAGITEAKGGVSVPALWRARRLPNPADTQGDIGRTGGILILYRKKLLLYYELIIKIFSYFCFHHTYVQFKG